MNRFSSLALSDSSSDATSPKKTPSKTSSLKLHREEAIHESTADPSNAVSGKWMPSLLSHLQHANISRPRTFFLPSRYEAKYRYPLIVWLHNDGFNEHQITHVAPHISTRNYIGVGIRGSMAIDACGQRFAWSTTPAAVSRCEDAVWQAIDDASDRYSVHPDRIFIAGYGEGATMARRIAFQRSSQFAGCIALGGRIPRGGSVLSNLSSARNLKNFWAVAIQNAAISQSHFDDDIRLAADARLRLEVRKYTTDDEMVTEVLGDVNTWMMKIVTGEDSRHEAKPDWTTVPVHFSAN